MTADRRPGHPRRLAGAAYARGSGIAEHGRLWAETRDPASHSGAAIGWVRRYRAADGQLYAVLLAAYFFLTMVPAVVVEATYVSQNPAELGDHVAQHLGLHGATAALVGTVLAGAGQHRFLSVLLAILNLVLFGLGFARVLQLAHARSWGIDLPRSALVDQARYGLVLLVMLTMSFLYVLQTRYLSGRPPAIGWILDAVWLGVLLGFFVWSPTILLHHRVSRRALVPGAVFTVLGLAALRLVSVIVLAHWLESYSRTYGALGIVMASFFWIIVAATILVLAAALSPALAHRRELLAAGLKDHPPG